jgi:predicted 2-oxoglutarate/Fe(II)-dependent dioxygenase YbiX
MDGPVTEATVAQRPMVTRGERGADFVARRGDGQPVRFYAYAGGFPTVLVFSGGGGGSAVRATRDDLADVLDDEVRIHAIAAGPPGTDETVFNDPQGLVHAAYGVPAGGDPAVVVLDPNVRVATAHVHRDAETTRAAVASAVTDLAVTRAASTVRHTAPVLFVPEALDPALCTRLLELWASSDTVETGVEATVAGQRAEATDRLRKRRRDHTVADPQLLRMLSSHVGRRVMPEIRKAFAYEAKRFEGFKIGCYEAEDAGFFTAHRDNLSPATAHRRFGLTLNLNEDYDGGELRFPEYGPERYRPAAREALVFSGAHLHEVLPVTRGRRFVLLSFVFGDEATGS